MQSQFIIEKILCSWVLSIYKVLYIFAMRYVFCLIHWLLKLLLTIVIGCSELTVPYVYKRQLLLVSSQTQLFFVQVLLNRHLLLLTWSFIKQSVLKQLLTEGEKMRQHCMSFGCYMLWKFLLSLYPSQCSVLYGTILSLLKILSGSVIERSMPDKWCPYVLVTHSFSMPGIVPTLP